MTIKDLSLDSEHVSELPPGNVRVPRSAEAEFRDTLSVWWHRVLRFVIRIPALVLIGVFRLWQLLVSPTYGQTCRFYPNCSSYGVQAVRVHGAVRGGWMTVCRIARCHPWNPGGVDPVPPSKRKHGDDHDHGDEAAHPERVT